MGLLNETITHGVLLRSTCREQQAHAERRVSDQKVRCQKADTTEGLTLCQKTHIEGSEGRQDRRKAGGYHDMAGDRRQRSFERATDDSS